MAKTRVRHELVLAGTMILGIAYTPAAHKVAVPEIAEQYIGHHKTAYLQLMNVWHGSSNTYGYIGSEAWKLSEQRKLALQKVQDVRKEIRGVVKKLEQDNRIEQMIESLAIVSLRAAKYTSMRSMKSVIIEGIKKMDKVPQSINVNEIKRKAGVITINMDELA